VEKETVKMPKNLVNTGFAEIVDNVESVDEPVNMTQNQGRRK